MHSHLIDSNKYVKSLKIIKYCSSGLLKVSDVRLLSWF